MALYEETRTSVKVMNLENIKDYFLKLTKQDFSQNQKIFITASFAWIIFVGYLTWWNGLRAPTLDKSFRWDEWFWFGIVPALAPYIFYFIWKKKDQ
jgi:cytoplasmic iron level regulating protein YaaA (DUF328/UPF0246 family)